MPSSLTLTAFYTFAPATLIKSAEVNNNFSMFRGHLISIDPSGATAGADMTWDLGGYGGHFWRGVYSQYGIMYANTAGSVPSTPSAGSVAIYCKSDGKVYKKTSSGIENEVGGGALVVTGSRSSPSTITAAGGVSFNANGGSRQLWYLTGDTSTGTDITANPQIVAGTDGQELVLMVPNTSTAYPVTFDDGNGLSLNGQRVIEPGRILSLFHDGTEWQETSFR